MISILILQSFENTFVLISKRELLSCNYRINTIIYSKNINYSRTLFSLLFDKTSKKKSQELISTYYINLFTSRCVINTFKSYFNIKFYLVFKDHENRAFCNNILFDILLQALINQRIRTSQKKKKL